MEGKVIAKCHVCDAGFPFKLQALQAMRLPATFCKRCYELFDMLTLRQWFKLDMAIRQLQAQEEWIKRVSGAAP